MQGSKSAQHSETRVRFDDQERIARHAEAFRRKAALKDVFRDIHKAMRRLDDTWFGSVTGARIELGAGVAPVRDTFGDVLATDIVPAPHLDAVMDAQDLQVDPGSVRALYLQNCFHHFPDPEAFFRTARKALTPGGGVVMVDPHWGPIASLVYPRLFREEGFDKRQESWVTPTQGPMLAANQALSYLVFKRDRKRFETLFPDLKIVAQGVLPNYLRYVLTGGLNFPQLLPTMLFPVVKGVETLVSPVAEVFGLHRWFVLRKDA